MSIDFKSNETKLADELDILLHTKSNVVLSKISSSQQFQDLIKKELNILFFLINKNQTSTALADKLVKRFNELSKSIFNVDKLYQPVDEYQLIDDINYLSIYIRNIFKVEIADLSKLDVKVDKPANEKVQTINTSNDQKVNAAGAAAMNAANPFLQAPARMRLQSEIKNGTVYVYKDKPKIMLILKMILISVFGLFSISLILNGIFIFLSNNFMNGVTYESGSAVHINTILSGIIYVLIALSFLWYDYKIYRDAFDKTKINDNLKYRLDYNYLFFSIGIFIFIYILDLFSYKALDHGSLFDSLDALIAYNPNMETVLSGWFYSEIICLVLFVILLIVIIITKVYNPKPDMDKINSLIKQYTDEIIKSTGM